jgi:ribosomal protein S27E
VHIQLPRSFFSYVQCVGSTWSTTLFLCNVSFLNNVWCAILHSDPNLSDAGCWSVLTLLTMMCHEQTICRYTQLNSFGPWEFWENMCLKDVSKNCSIKNLRVPSLWFIIIIMSRSHAAIGATLHYWLCGTTLFFPPRGGSSLRSFVLSNL